MSLDSFCAVGHRLSRNHGEVEAAESRKDFLHKLRDLSEGTSRSKTLAASGYGRLQKSFVLPGRNLPACLNEARRAH